MLSAPGKQCFLHHPCRGILALIRISLSIPYIFYKKFANLVAELCGNLLSIGCGHLKERKSTQCVWKRCSRIDVLILSSHMWFTKRPDFDRAIIILHLKYLPSLWPLLFHNKVRERGCKEDVARRGSCLSKMCCETVGVGGFDREANRNEHLGDYSRSNCAEFSG